MNTLLKAAAESVEMGWLLGGMTLVFLLFFLAWGWWAYAPSRREKMEEYARIPFEDGVIDGE